MNFVLFPVPKLKIEGDKLVCGNRQTTLSVDISDAPESVWNYPGSFTWNSKDSLVTFKNQEHQSVNIEVHGLGGI